MFGHSLLFAIVIFFCIILLSLTLFFVIVFYDLESKYIDSIDCCNKLNQFVLPEIGLQASLVFLFFVTGHWFSLLINLPLATYNIKKIAKRTHMYDAIEVLESLSQSKQEGCFKLGFYALCFLYYTYRLSTLLVMAK
ncbi:cornichon [Sporodiniella umbellata]|nr:cornichon [Sporodiniella umbellata]